MSDPFALLGLPRRPLLSEDEIGTAYRNLAGKIHPDQAQGDSAAFRLLGEAEGILRDPARRLRALADITGNDRTGSSRQLPPQAADLFPKIASLMQESNNLTARHATASNPLAKALLAAPLRRLSSELESTLSLLALWKKSLDHDLQELDRRWPEHDPEMLPLLSDSFAYAGRWEGQLRERTLALQSCLA
jgi:curved DNA-binding protein CbpA